jgi:predicted nucleic-acid-binding protein
MEDEPLQFSKAKQLIGSFTKESPGFVTMISIAELYWVLDRSYKISRARIAETIAELLDSEELRIENTPIVTSALEISSSSNADFGDCLIQRCATAAGCVSVLTFDRNAAKSAGMLLLS